MTLEQKAGLPFGESFPVHVQISIFSNGSEYMAYISADMGMFYRIPIQLRPHDIKDLNKDLQRGIERVAGSIEVGENCIPALRDLARIGNFAFKSIFPQGPRRETIRSALKAGTTVQVSAEDFAIPWELLYDGPVDDDDDEVDITRFWGVQHIIARSIVQDARPGDFVPSSIVAPRPRVGVIAYNGLEHVAKQEIPALRKLHRNKKIALSCLHPLNASQPEKGLTDFGRFLQGDHHIVHLACHAREAEPVYQSYLWVTDEFKISIKDFVVHEFEIKSNPFVILNACLTGVINPLHTYYWAAEFWKRGARGVLATDFHVPDSFAAAFSEELYRHLLAGEPVGEALLAARRHFWTKDRNPLGLAYALYSSPSIRIVNAN